MEIGRLIHRRYVLQRLIQQGQVCSIYQGVDQLLQRSVAVKAVPAHQVVTYRTAIRMTSHFSHPNIVGIYDLISESESLYIVEEYVEGDEFSTLLQMSLLPHQVADLGCQICQALLYAGSSSRKVCHGDLTPTAILRDRQGIVRVRNFALPGDLRYFESWSVVGHNGVVISDEELPLGQISPARHADDTRAVALLLYQLLAGRPAGATRVDPPADGQLRFLRSTPPELCETIARAVVRSHPQNISTAEALYKALKPLAEAPEPAIAPETGSVFGEQAPRQFAPAASGPASSEDPRGAGKLVSALPAREAGNTGLRLPAYRSGAEPAVLESSPDAPTTVASAVAPFATSQQELYQGRAVAPRRSPILWLLLLGLVIFALFFVVGYFAGHLLFH